MAHTIDKSLEYYKKAVEIIPGGSQMFNKRPCIYQPANYPIFAEKAEGAYLYDVDGNKYIDYLLAYGAILLGYSYQPVKEAVIKQIEKGTINSVNDPLEIELAEELVNTIPSAEMVRYFLSGSEATSAAVRIARAYTGRDKIIKCGYHGWHDWTTIVKGGPTKGMANYLDMINCPVESIAHIPQEISQFTTELEYNNLDSLKAYMEREGKNVACIIMEPFYFEVPDDGFLEGVKNIAHKYGSVFILDEVKTGVRVSQGGAQEYFGIVPDMSVFSKAMSNGYPFSLVVGKKSVMSVCEKLWFAGTNSGNAVGIIAALTTLRESKKVDAPQHIWKLGERIVKEMKNLLKIYDIEGDIGGLPPMPQFIFIHDNIERKKRMTGIYLSEMIDNGIFMPVEHCFFISYAHSVEDIDRTLEAIEKAFKKIKKLLS